MSIKTEKAAYRFDDLHPEMSDFYAEVIDGLRQSPMTIPPKFFYDEKGSQLFDAICRTKEYYPTRTETKILRDNIEAIGRHLGTGCLLIEPGSGNSQKVRELLDAIKPHTYLPMDISQKYLQKEAGKLAGEYPWLNVHAVCADFTSAIDLPYSYRTQHRVAFFPGSSIGNFDPQDATEFMVNIAQMVGPGGGLLIGVDLVKDIEVLEAAYNDSEGYTAGFNLNLLSRINRDLDANFDLQGFRHRAFYNEHKGRVEMHIDSVRDQRVTIGAHEFRFRPGDAIHTECSYKYTVQGFQALAREAGFEPVEVWMDESELFSLHYFNAL